MTKFSELIQILFTKIFHDLSGPVGVINNCLALCDHKSQWIRSQSREIVLSEMKNLVMEMRLYKFIFGYDYEDFLMDNNHISKYFLELENNSEADISLEIKDQIHINAQVIKSLLCLIKLELEYGKNNPNKKISVFLNREELLIIVEDNEPEYIHKLLKFFDGICKDITLNNCYLHYIQLLTNEAGYQLKFERDNNIRKYIFNYQ
ncbi:MAG: hypothetical protein H6909_05260 [Rickettsiaceae bacterium]|nr:hypothetical protein [Rickettsiaceae bacterium]